MNTPIPTHTYLQSNLGDLIKWCNVVHGFIRYFDKHGFTSRLKSHFHEAYQFANFFQKFHSSCKLKCHHQSRSIWSWNKAGQKPANQAPGICKYITYLNLQICFWNWPKQQMEEEGCTLQKANLIWGKTNLLNLISLTWIKWGSWGLSPCWSCPKNKRWNVQWHQQTYSWLTKTLALMVTQSASWSE